MSGWASPGWLLRAFSPEDRNVDRWPDQSSVSVQPKDQAFRARTTGPVAATIAASFKAASVPFAGRDWRAGAPQLSRDPYRLPRGTGTIR